MKGHLFKKYLVFFLFLILILPNVSWNSSKALNEPFETIYTAANSYNELVGWYKNLESEYPNYIEVFKANEIYNLGKIKGGYDAWYVRITNESLGLKKPEVLYLGSPHGDETVGTNLLYWFTDWLMRMAFTSEPCPDYSKEWLRWLIDNREIYIEVAHNPYGFDHGPQRYDGNGWDLNREADHDGPGNPTGGIWGSIPGKTLYNFVNDHQFRCGADFHGGTRMILYSWSSSHDSITGTSPITGKSFSHAPPDFYFCDASSLRLADYIGDYGGDINENRVGTIPDTVGYEAKGGIAPWAYGADVVSNPAEDPYVQDEQFGNYPGSGIHWISPEWSYKKNEPDSKYGGDTTEGYGQEIRRFCLHQTDIAQPYVRWQPETPENDSYVSINDALLFRWQVNGSLVVDNTFLQWGKNPDPINNPEHQTEENKENEGKYIGGTGWDKALDGKTDGVTYEEEIKIDETGDYYFVSKAKVDQIYSNVLAPEEYGDNPYLRLIKERTDPNYHEEIQGLDGLEVIDGQIWWYSPVIHVKVVKSMHPSLSYSPKFYNAGEIKKGDKISTSFEIWNEGVEELEYQLNSDEEWLTIDSSSGTSGGEHDNISIEIDTSYLNDGLYETSIEINSNGGDGMFNVTFEVFSDPIISINPSSYDFGKQSKNKKISTTFEIKNEKENNLEYNINSDEDWISINPKEGSSSGETDSITVLVDTNSLSVGTYNGEVTIESNGGNKIFSVTLEVVSEPVLSITPEIYDFGKQSKNKKISTTFEIKNTGESLLEYSIHSDETWIKVDPTTGTCSEETDIITVEIDTMNLDNGINIGKIHIESNGGEKTFEVKVNVSSPSPDEGNITIKPKKLSLLGIKAEIENIDNKNLSHVNWSISVTGGFLDRINISKNGFIETLNVGETKKISTKSFFDLKSKIFGFGKIHIEIIVGNEKLSKDGKVFGPVIILR